MEKEYIIPDHPANSQTTDSGLTSYAPPNPATFRNGQSVDNAPISTMPFYRPDKTQHWYVIRATRGRAQNVYDELVAINSPLFEVYLPCYHYEKLLIEEGDPKIDVTEEPIHNGLLFLRTTRTEFIKLLHNEYPYPFIQGLTPYYDHFREIETGRNDYLVVPDKQFNDFRTIIQSQDQNILIDQKSMPTYLNGKKVEVISGPFAGVTGTMLRWKGLRRVFIQLDQLGTYGTGFIRTCDFRLLEDYEA